MVCFYGFLGKSQYFCLYATSQLRTMEYGTFVSILEICCYFTQHGDSMSTIWVSWNKIKYAYAVYLKKIKRKNYIQYKFKIYLTQYKKILDLKLFFC